MFLSIHIPSCFFQLNQHLYKNEGRVLISMYDIIANISMYVNVIYL